MQTIWSRTAQVRSSCRCPSCFFQHRTVPRRRITSSLANHVYSSTTGFAVSFSTAVAGASYLDAKSKHKRRAALNNSIAQAQADARALRENQDARLRALGIEQESEAEAAADMTDTPRSHTHSNSPAAPRHKPSPQLASFGKVLSGEVEEGSLEPLEGEETKDALGVYFAQAPWEKRTYGLPGFRDALTKELLLTRMIYQFELLTLYMSIRATEESQSSMSVENLRNIHKVEIRLKELDLLFKRAREAIWQQAKHGEDAEARMDAIYEDMDSADIHRVQYDWGQSQRDQWTTQATQEEELLQFFTRTHYSTEILVQLNQFLINCGTIPSIHAFNIIIIGLCDHSLPCAAKLVLEFLRKADMGANAVTHEAAIKCALFDRDKRFFAAYVHNMRGENRLGWHGGLEGNTARPVLAFKHAKLQSRGWQPRMGKIYHASVTPSGAEAIIRGFLRFGRLSPALREYKQFREAGGVPTIHLLEAFLRYCLFTHDVDLAQVTWQQICLLPDRPSSSVYYWMLAVLAYPLPEGARYPVSTDEGRKRREHFKSIALELKQEYGWTRPPLQWQDFTTLGCTRRKLSSMAANIEDLSIPQSLPSLEREPLPDLMSVHGHPPGTWASILPRNLGSYLHCQEALLKEHTSSDIRIHRTSDYKEFFNALLETDYSGVDSDYFDPSFLAGAEETQEKTL